LFEEDPQQFVDYHEGYRQQVLKWPRNPLEILMHELSKVKYRGMKIADFGCGEGKLQLHLEAQRDTEGERGLLYPKGCIHSFDAGKMTGPEYAHITQCDIASVPLQAHTLDIAVFCLSLMGTNYVDFLLEANRVMKVGATLLVAEVLSRFANVDVFTDALMPKAGFKKIKVQRLNDFFYIMVFLKVADADESLGLVELAQNGGALGDASGDAGRKPLLKACFYKKR